MTTTKRTAKRETRERELAEAREQQAATSAILRLLSTPPSGLQPVFDMIARSAKQLCHGRFSSVFRFDGELIHLVGHYGLAPAALKAYRKRYPRPPGRETAIGRAILTRAIAHIPDVDADSEYGQTDLARTVAFRSIVAVPILRESQPVGGIVVLRSVPELFPERQIELLKTFADQAAIAIENTRLFQAIQAGNRDLTEALEYQTATSEVLRIMSSSLTDLQPVFDRIAESAKQLCHGQFCAVFRFDGELMHFVGHYGLKRTGLEAYRQTYPRPPGWETAIGRAILTRTVAHIPDVDADSEYGHGRVARALTFRSIVAVPILRENDPIGGIVVARSVAQPFSDKQIELLNTFANQAMVAIEGVQLFQEVSRQLTVIREVFGKYVPENVAEAIVAGQGNLKPLQTTATILYSDLEAFTSIAEGMPPEQVVQMLNEYFPAVIEPIRRHGGIVNQFQGDAMLVTFNVPVEDPRHADKAIMVASEIQEIARRCTFAGVTLRTRIGINTGTVIAGNVGSGDRINYTVHGDAVNLAARLEQLNKDYDTLVLVSGATVSLLTESHPIEFIGEVEIRGKHEPVQLFKLAI